MKLGSSRKLTGFPNVVMSEVVYWAPQWTPGRLMDKTGSGGGSGDNYGVCKLSEMVFKDYVLLVHTCIFIEEIFTTFSKCSLNHRSVRPSGFPVCN